MTDPAAVDAAVLFRLNGTGKGGSDDLAFQVGGRRGHGGRDASSHGQEVDKLKDENPWKCSAQIGDPNILVSGRLEQSKEFTYVAKRVMYVPPMAGSAMRAWKAEMDTNMTVFMNVETTCSKMTVNKYQTGTASSWPPG